MSATARDAVRRGVLEAFGASAAEAGELLDYGANRFSLDGLARIECDRFDDEPFVAVWESYAEAAQRAGAWSVLRDRLVQLRFPIRAGIGGSSEYRASTRSGRPRDAGEDVQPIDPDGIRLFLHRTHAGRIPVIAARTRADFVALVQALTRRNEPDPIPDAMGACMVAGYTNWHRVGLLRAAWRGDEETWRAAWPSLDKASYQDRFILLSEGPYSGVPAAEMSCDETEWQRLSFTIRLEHECAHYLTRRVFGSMQNALLDEIIADYAGIVAACGDYRADWFLRFVGLDRPDRYRAGARLDTYRGRPPLSDGAFAVLQALVRAAASHLAQFDRERCRSGRRPPDVVRMIGVLASLSVEELAADDGLSRLRTVSVPGDRGATCGV